MPGFELSCWKIFSKIISFAASFDIEGKNKLLVSLKMFNAAVTS